ncbi:carboxymuconolactone decarboxylase family protein [Legionella sp. km772]|uniref:carboxymuconolactone decarboxylase family protein n=1 Tax=Legionella sp. km772 TaxID=2498111 RepID=UPI000F8CCDD8|nr:carboxymuconolactone decarboxylase family protein [Legionella sp. km772]RUR06741.1 carboxymuconolactone decarboxylase family protein [Legionella sp. km772]
MARVNYLDEKTTRIAEELVNPIKKRRPNGRLLNLDKVLIHSEALTKGWQAMFSQLRQNLSTPSALNELVILRVALINKALYEFQQHEPEASKAGISASKINALAMWDTSNLFSPTERAVLAYTDAMTRFIQVPDSIYNEVKVYFNEQQIVELTALIAGYNMVSRFLEALEITTEGE